MPFTGQKTPDVVLEDGRIQPGMRVYVPPTVKPPVFVRLDVHMKRHRWTPEDLKDAQTMGFPMGDGRGEYTIAAGTAVARMPLIAQDAIDRWFETGRRLLKLR